MNKTLNIGCGDRTFTEYPPGHLCVNLDERELEGVDVVGDVRDLSGFADGEFNYILASDIIEHFPIAETEDLIKYWSRVLATGGILEIRTPNLLWAMAYYRQHRDAKFVSWHIFGGQDYPGNFHYVMFDKAWLLSILEPLGFVEYSYAEDGSNLILKVRKI